MALIAPQVTYHRKPHTMRLDERVLVLLRRYAEFIDSSADYVINQALVATFTNDGEFQSWLNGRYIDDANLLDGVRNDGTAVPATRRRRRPAVRRERLNRQAEAV